ncbi:hypothetical protein RZE82_04840 [Mollicutes bacterium LVI A0039]|nr:hypothetical protein RZE82_04840 [Mollicutes bacterium LVI A0039]
MLSNIRDVVTAIIVGIVAFVIIILFFILTLEKKPLTIDSFQIGHQTFTECVTDYSERNELYQDYANELVLKMPVAELSALRTQLEVKVSCPTSYVTSNEEQLEVYAAAVYEYVQSQGFDQEYKLLDTIYTAPASYYAYLQQPQDYLFWAMSADEQVLIAYVYEPGSSEGHITQLWSEESGSDLEFVQASSNNLLVKYFEKVN